MGEAYLVQNFAPAGVQLPESGMHYYNITAESALSVEYFQLSNAFDILNKGTRTHNLTTNTLARVDNIAIAHDGSVIYVASSDNKYVARFYLSTPFDTRTAGSQTTLTLSDMSDGEITCFHIDNNGTRLYMSDGGGRIRQYNLTTPNDITTRVYTNNWNVTLSANGPGDPAFSPDGTKVVIGQRGGSTIRGGTCSTPWDLSTYSQTHSFNTSDADPSAVKWNGDGTRFFVRHASPDMVNEFSVTTPYTLAGASFVRQVYNNPAFAAGGHDFNYSR